MLTGNKSDYSNIGFLQSHEFISNLGYKIDVTLT